MSEPTWQESLYSLRRRSGVAAALANAATLAVAMPHWQGRVVPRTSMFDLLFTLPGQAYPFPAWVRVHWDDGTTTITRVVDREPVEQVTAPADTVDTVLDGVLHRLTRPT